MSWLSLDIEWNQIAKSGERDVLSIAGVLRKERTDRPIVFESYTRPRHLELVATRTLELLHTDRHTLALAPPLKAVLASFSETLGHCDTLIVWHRDALETFTSILNQHGLRFPASRVVILQELLGVLVQERRWFCGFPFPLMLNVFDVKYRPSHLHKSKYDAIYLMGLYDAMWHHLEAQNSQTTLYHTKTSGTLHTPDCRYLIGRETKQVGLNAILSGHSICKCCARTGSLRVLHLPKPTKKELRSVKHTPVFSEQALERHCANLGLRCSCSIGWVFIASPAGHWKIKHTDGIVSAIYHENNTNRSASAKANGGYHRQNISITNIFDAATYIRNHDIGRLRGKLRRLPR